MIQHKALRGVIAALLTPRTESGSVDFDLLESNLRFVLGQGVAGVCLLGATGEYARATMDERRAIVQAAKQWIPSEKILAVAVGAAASADSIRLARHAQSAGADVVLVPVPFFFRYSQDDIEQMYQTVAAEVPLPVLIYNLPAFTGGVEPLTAVRLIQCVDNIVGIKDSGGLESLQLLSSPGATCGARLVGNDAHLVQALERRICDGTISGIAGVLPELTVALVEAGLAGDKPALAQCNTLLEELLPQLDQFPAPWGLKLIAECREFGKPGFSLPLSPAREAQAERFQQWFGGWWSAASRVLAQLAAPNPV